MSATRCDAIYCTDDDGTAGRVTVVTVAGTESAPVGACSGDRVTVWHGMSTPALACGRHAHQAPVAVFRGHRNRVGAS